MPLLHGRLVVSNIYTLFHKCHLNSSVMAKRTADRTYKLFIYSKGSGTTIYMSDNRVSNNYFWPYDKYKTYTFMYFSFKKSLPYPVPSRMEEKEWFTSSTFDDTTKFKIRKDIWQSAAWLNSSNFRNRITNDIDADLYNGPRSNVNIPIESQ